MTRGVPVSVPHCLFAYRTRGAERGSMHLYVGVYVSLSGWVLWINGAERIACL